MVSSVGLHLYHPSQVSCAHKFCSPFFRHGVKPELQRQLCPNMENCAPPPANLVLDVVTTNQTDRVGHKPVRVCREGASGIHDFRAARGLGRHIFLWTASTEPFTDIQEETHDASDSILAALVYSGARPPWPQRRPQLDQLQAEMVMMWRDCWSCQYILSFLEICKCPRCGFSCQKCQNVCFPKLTDRLTGRARTLHKGEFPAELGSARLSGR